jgi:hypothetical protein
MMMTDDLDLDLAHLLVDCIMEFLCCIAVLLMSHVRDILLVTRWHF